MSTECLTDRDGERGNDGRDLNRRLHRCGTAVAERELRIALATLDGLTPAQRRTVARMAGRIAAGVLAPAREAADGGDERSVERLFDPERIRE
jgi:hypothetical protein